MNFDSYFDFINELNNKKLLSENLEIGYFKSGKEFLQKEILFKEIEKEIITIKVYLEDDSVLLIEDFPENFLLSHSIFISPDTEIFQFRLKGDKYLYYAQKDLVGLIDEEKIDGDVERIDPKKLNLKKYYFSFDQPKIITELKNFIFQVKGLDLNKIHIKKEFNTVRNFIPTLSFNDFRLAKKLSIPTTILIKNNYIKDTVINIFDTPTQIKKIKPLNIRKIKTKWSFDKDNNMLYRALKKEIYISWDKNKIVEIVNNCHSNQDLDRLIERVTKLKKLQLSRINAELILPIWKKRENAKFFTFKNQNDFLMYTGLEFKADKEFLKRVFIQDEHGEEVRFYGKFLNPELKKSISKLNDNFKDIHFETYSELILKLLYLQNPVNIIQQVPTTSNQINKLEKLNKKILRLLIEKCIKFNKIPNPPNKNDCLGEYLLSIYNKLEKEYDKYRENQNISELIKNSIKNLEKLQKVLKGVREHINESHLYSLEQIFLTCYRILKRADIKKAEVINQMFEEFFPQKPMPCKDAQKINPNLEIEIEKTSLANIIHMKHKSSYILLKKDFYAHQLLDSNIIKINKNPNSVKIKPNTRKIKNTFPYRAEEIIKQVKTNQSTNIELSQDKKIELKEEFYSTCKIFKKLKIKIDNEFFTLYVPQENQSQYQ